MSDRMEYRVIEKSTSNALTGEVLAWMAMGWEPIGGVSVAITENMNYGTSYCQAIIKRPEPPNKKGESDAKP